MLASLVIAFAQVVSLLVELYVYVLIARALISWVNPDPYNPIVKFLHSVTDPLLSRVRRFAPFLYINGIDLTPIALLVALQFAKQVVVNLLYGLSQSL